MTLTDSTLSGNSATGAGGGGILNGVATVTDSTLSGNSADVQGGGIDNFGTLTVTDSTLSRQLSHRRPRRHGRGIYNFSGKLTVTANIFDNPDGGNISTQSGSTFVSLGHNLFSDAPAVALDLTDLINTDPKLGPLADNGGPTLTMALLPGSPAIDAGATVAGVTTDQRGVPRPQGAAPDIGAYQSRGFTITVISGNGQVAPVHQPFPAPLVVVVSSRFGEPVAGGRVTFSAPTTGPSAGFTANPATIGASGRAGIHASANGLPGSYAVTARAAGASSVALTLTNVAPVVVSLQRTGIHLQPTRLVLTFNLPLNAATAQDLRNYLLYPVGPRGFAGPNPQPIPIVSAVYDPAHRTVTLTPQSRLALTGYYLLTVSGVGAHPVREVYGDPLTGTGTGGLPGDYIALVHGYGPWLPAASACRVLIRTAVRTGSGRGFDPGPQSGPYEAANTGGQATSTRREKAPADVGQPDRPGNM